MSESENPDPVMVDLKKYMAEIGRRGGKANKGKAAEKCRLAAQARWAKYRAEREEDQPEDESS